MVINKEIIILKLLNNNNIDEYIVNNEIKNKKMTN